MKKPGDSLKRRPFPAARNESQSRFLDRRRGLKFVLPHGKMLGISLLPGKKAHRKPICGLRCAETVEKPPAKESLAEFLRPQPQESN